mmetsp:Transcript_48015/g.58141  ORF Transcript_48015/g.58141 Transcript_48015/m.58141 type:complete len:464 (+) Transcript_48015:133-1524(+)
MKSRLHGLSMIYVLIEGIVHAHSGMSAEEQFSFVGSELWNIYSGKGWTTPSIEEVSNALGFSTLGGADVFSERYFKGKPLVVLSGQFSTGKTTFIQDIILGAEYPDSYIAPNPSTDQFTLITNGGTREKCARSAQHAAGQGHAQKSSLAKFRELGDGFLQRLTFVKVSHEDAPILKYVDILDTPGILSTGHEQEEHYDLAHTWQHIANHADMILVMFDVKSGDISDRFNHILKHFAAVKNKVHLIFNKADTLKAYDLLQVFGGIMWKLGTVIKQPESERVYFGSFHKKPCESSVAGEYACNEFDANKRRILEKIHRLPYETATRRVGHFELFLHSLEVMYKLIRHLHSVVPSYNAWTGKCQNIDTNGDAINSEKVLQMHIDEAINFYGWKSSVLPDLQRFKGRIANLGGVCNIPVALTSYLDSIENAKKKLLHLNEKLSAEPPKSFFASIFGGNGDEEEQLVF